MERDRRSARGQRVVVALFEDRDDATSAIRDLHGNGFNREQIGVAMRDRSAEGELLDEGGSRGAETAAAGAVGGGVLGGLVGLLVGIGALVIPGTGPVVAGGALASALGVAGGAAAAGAGIGAATGGVLGALVGMGVPQEEASYFDRGFREGGIIVSVDPRGREPDALDILELHGGDLGASYAEVSVDGGFGGSADEWRGTDRRTANPGRRRTDR